MTADPIVVIAMRTWGELGNRLAACTLAGELERHFGPTHVIEAERFFLSLSETGEVIRQIALADEAPAAKRHQYSREMEHLEALMDAGRDGFAAGVEDLSRYLAAVRPRLVVATKGLIARLALVAARRVARIPVVSYVTNPGLLELAIHRCAHVWTFVPFERDREALVRHHGFSGDRVLVVGKLLPVGRGWLGAAPVSAPADARPRAILLANRGGLRFRRLVDELARRIPEVELSVIALHDRQLARRVAYHRQASGVAHWRAQESLVQGAYMRHVRWLVEGPRPVLISKTGPNTMLEAAYFGIPQILLDSGLPMEAWVSRFVADTGIGAVVEHEREAVDRLIAWERRPQEHEACRRRALELARLLLDQERAAQAHHAAFDAVLSTPAASHLVVTANADTDAHR
jgi:hypothetical protein